MSRHEYMLDSKGLDWLEVHFDDDGTLEALKAYCPLIDAYIHVVTHDIDRPLPRLLMAKIEAFIADQIQTVRDQEEAV